MEVKEPTLEALRNPVLRYLLAARPAFLSVTLGGWLIGMGTAHRSGVPLDGAGAALSLAFALLAHAGINVLNDYYDALSGADAINEDRIFPFTGGSRFIQNGVLSPAQTGAFGAALFGAVIAAGLYLVARSGVGLLWLGMAGLALGWAYSAPPLKLVGRGIGEACVAAGFALIVAGTDYVQRGAFDALPWVAGLSYALLVANLLYINQFPDREADARSAKRHLVVRLGPARARWGYPLISGAAYAWLAAAVLAGALPSGCLVALAAALPSMAAAKQLWRWASRPALLGDAIKLTIAAALLHAALLAGALLVS